MVTMSSTIRTRAPSGMAKPRRSCERAVLALDEDRLGAELARRLVARHDAADRRRDDDSRSAPKAARDLLGQRPAQPLGAHRVLKTNIFCRKIGAAQARRQDEMALEQRAGGAEFGEDLVGRHGGRPFATK